VNSDTVVSLDNSVGFVFRHNRLFNYLVSPIHMENGLVKCHVGRNSYRDIPIDYFKRDWKKDDKISYKDLIDKIGKFPDQTPFTAVYDTVYEVDDGVVHSYIHFNDDMSEKMVRFPTWRLTTCTKSERNDKINPYTMIMPVKDELLDEIQKELDIINEIRKENEFIQIDDFKGFEFGLIKILEKKYLRSV
jgi:hypothetical protein